jgi:hypothetical protein
MGVLRALAGTLERTLVKPWRIIGDADLDYSPTGRIWVGTQSFCLLLSTPFIASIMGSSNESSNESNMGRNMRLLQLAKDLCNDFVSTVWPKGHRATGAREIANLAAPHQPKSGNIENFTSRSRQERFDGTDRANRTLS